MVTVSISETYDLSTKVDKMTLIAIHTPRKELIQKTYPGLAMQYRYFRIKSVDCSLVAVSHLPISPDQVGQDTNQIAPQDILNPILYKAVSNDSWSTLEARLMGIMHSGSSTIGGSMAEVENDNVTGTGLSDDFGVYYSLLSNRDGFRISHPQQGLAMKGLRPLVFEKWYTHGENAQPNNDYAPDLTEDASSNIVLSNGYASGMRGRPHPMPRLNTTYLTGSGLNTEVAGVNAQYSGMGNGQPSNYQIEMPNIEPLMCGAIIIPPAKKTVMYYRMVCRVWLEFTEVRPIQDITSFYQMDTYYAPVVYHSDYVEQSKRMDETTDLVDVRNGDIQKIMEGR